MNYQTVLGFFHADKPNMTGKIISFRVTAWYQIKYNHTSRYAVAKYNVIKNYLEPGKRGRSVKSSAIIAPIAHISKSNR